LKRLQLLVWVFTTLSAYSQIEDLEKSLLLAKGSERMLVLESLSHQLENNNISRASALAKEALALAKQEENLLREQQILGWLGYLLRLQNVYDSSSFYFQRAIESSSTRTPACRAPTIGVAIWRCGGRRASWRRSCSGTA
jgi:hypothetical protein